MAVNLLKAATAPACGVEVGRITEQGGRFLPMKVQGRGII